MSAEDDGPAAIGRAHSTVSFRGADGEDDGGDDEENSPMLVESARTRVFSVSKDRPITRIPTRVEMKTLTHKAKRPAVDVEFHDLTYAVNTPAGKSVRARRRASRFTRSARFSGQHVSVRLAVSPRSVSLNFDRNFCRHVSPQIFIRSGCHYEYC